MTMTKTTGKLYHPKGEMCLGCKKLREDCSSLPFSSYYKLEEYDEGIIVRCKEYDKVDNSSR